MSHKTIESEILVLGAGITGLSTAFNLTKKGKQVTVIDRIDRVGSDKQASAVNCGIMCCSAHSGSPLGQLLFGISYKIAQEMGDDIKFIKSGSVEICQTEEECLWGRALVDLQRSCGYGEDQIVWLEKDKVKDVEPNIGPNCIGAVYFPDEGNINPKRFTKTMGIMAKGAGATINLNRSIESITFKDGSYHVHTKHTQDGSELVYKSKTVVFATGAQTNEVVGQLGVDIPVVPVRGTMWSTAPVGEKICNTTILAAESHAYFYFNNKKLTDRGIPPSVTHPSMYSPERFTRHIFGKQTHDGCIIFGGDRKPEIKGAQPDSPVETSSNSANKKHSEEFFPKIKDHKIVREWTGLMPFSKDGSLIVGKIDQLPANAYVISGMASGGMMQGPGAGQLLPDMICGCPEAKKTLEPADPNRFFKSLQAKL